MRELRRRLGHQPAADVAVPEGEAAEALILLNNTALHPEGAPLLSALQSIKPAKPFPEAGHRTGAGPRSQVQRGRGVPTGRVPAGPERGPDRQGEAPF